VKEVATWHKAWEHSYSAHSHTVQQTGNALDGPSFEPLSIVGS
jgi:hypothetical protein